MGNLGTDNRDRSVCTEDSVFHRFGEKKVFRSGC